MTARRTMVRGLRDDRLKRLLADWGALLEELVARPSGDRPDATVPIGELAARRIRKVYRRMVKLGAAIDPHSAAEDYHELRKKGKELRYLLELFGTPLFPREVVKPMIKTLKSLQDVLGRHQDREVQVATLRTLRNEVSAHPDGAAALMAMGVLVMRLHEDEQAARDEFARALRPVRVEVPARARERHVRMSRVLATYNIKGGVGKTSAAVNLAYLASRDGAPTLLWDLDPQAASTYLFRVRPEVRGGGRRARAALVPRRRR